MVNLKSILALSGTVAANTIPWSDQMHGDEPFQPFSDLQTTRYRHVGNNGEQSRYNLIKPDFSFWEDTRDDILTEFKVLMRNAEANGQNDPNLKMYQKFVELIDMIMYLQRVPFFGQYWYYGCWCAPEGFENALGRGYGKPRDNIDKSCRSMSYCYECAKIDKGSECTTSEVNYNWHGALDAEGNKQIICDDDEGTCEHTLCLCDKKLAEDLRQHENEWDLHTHQKWGDFNREVKCFETSDPVAAAEQSHQDYLKELAQAATNAGTEDWIEARGFGNALANYEQFGLNNDQPSLDLFKTVLKMAGDFGDAETKFCCGEYPTRTPLKKKLHNGDNNPHQCCNQHIFNTNSECCNYADPESPEVVKLGTGDSCVAPPTLH